jgi:hypothetical protein
MTKMRESKSELGRLTCSGLARTLLTEFLTDRNS